MLYKGHLLPTSNYLIIQNKIYKLLMNFERILKFRKKDYVFNLNMTL